MTRLSCFPVLICVILSRALGMGLKRICKFLEASRYSWRFEPMGFVGKRALISRRDAEARRRAVGLEALRLRALYRSEVGPE
jgi:hypothetical protein